MATLQDTASFAEAKKELLAEAERRGKSVEVLYLVIVKGGKAFPRGRWKILTEVQFHKRGGGYQAKVEWYSDEAGWRMYER